jgi:hypothetical protein
MRSKQAAEQGKIARGIRNERPSGTKAHLCFQFLAAQLNSLLKQACFQAKICENIPQRLKPPLILLALYRDYSPCLPPERVFPQRVKLCPFQDRAGSRVLPQLVNEARTLNVKPSPSSKVRRLYQNPVGFKA